MRVYRLGRSTEFPDPRKADPSGLLAVGGDLRPERLLQAYSCGIFPWFSQGEPILWWCPDPRMVLAPGEFHVAKSTLKLIRRAPFRITADSAFEAVVGACARSPRPGQHGTWITRSMLRAYVALHEQGHAHSVEAWEGDELVGGLYGVAVGALFAGESMFTLRPNASKVAFVHAMAWLVANGCALVDCQVHTSHLARFGARDVPRDTYLDILPSIVTLQALPVGRWDLDVPAAPAGTAGHAQDGT